MWRNMQRLALTVFSEMKIHFEQDVHRVYDQVNFFKDLTLTNLFSSAVEHKLSHCEKLGPYTFELICNYVLELIVTLYLNKALADLALKREFKYIKSLFNDIKNFQRALKGKVPSNLSEIYCDYLFNFFGLFESARYDDLLKDLLKLNVFLERPLEIDMLCLILNNNINIRADIEDQLIAFYNQCLQRASIGPNNSINLEKQTKQKKKSKNKARQTSIIQRKKRQSLYPYVSPRVIVRMKGLLFEARRRLYDQKLALQWDSFDTSLVNQSAMERNLENILKVVLLEHGYDNEELVYMLTNKQYYKLKCKVTDSRVEFRDSDSHVLLMSIRMNMLHSVKPHGDLIIKMNYKSITICLVLPTKIERNIWLYSIKNLKHTLTHTLEDYEFPSLKSNAFKFVLKKSKVNLRNYQMKYETLKAWDYSLKERRDYRRIRHSLVKDKKDSLILSRRSTLEFNDLEDDQNEVSDSEFQSQNPFLLGNNISGSHKKSSLIIKSDSKKQGVQNQPKNYSGKKHLQNPNQDYSSPKNLITVQKKLKMDVPEDPLFQQSDGEYEEIKEIKTPGIQNDIDFESDDSGPGELWVRDELPIAQIVGVENGVRVMTKAEDIGNDESVSESD